eukprot:TRINITY_DN22741_c0_g1_i2.p1 TRINITY_DN22741_c0_g1~~TRINITY_DN22741_c0_g1_i2.p1  ORF type:complete len:109 (-),score=20.61 TRINITY_DN22741_c0_g1_i2:10-336(-)
MVRKDTEASIASSQIEGVSDTSDTTLSRSGSPPQKAPISKEEPPVESNLPVDKWGILKSEDEPKPDSKEVKKMEKKRKARTRVEAKREQIGRAVQQECRDRSRMPSSA